MGGPAADSGGYMGARGPATSSGFMGGPAADSGCMWVGVTVGTWGVQLLKVQLLKAVHGGSSCLKSSCLKRFMGVQLLKVQLLKAIHGGPAA